TSFKALGETTLRRPSVVSAKLPFELANERQAQEPASARAEERQDYHGNGSFTVDCTIRNLSATGARLQVPTTVAIPDRFTFVEQGQARRPAKVVWRKNDLIGVQFE